MNRPELSIIIPCFNEVENIPSLVKKLKTIQNNNIEIILVDNGSSDNTRNILSKELSNQKKLLRSLSIDQNIGYGHGIMSGVKEASGDVIAWTHADLQTDPIDIMNAFLLYKKNSNYKKYILKGKRVGRNLFDNVFTFGMSTISSLLMGIKLSDINAQPKMFHRSFLENIKNAPDDFSLDLFFLFQAKVKGYGIIEYPVTFGKRIHGESKGGGTIKGKIKLIRRTWNYMVKLKQEIKG